MVILILFWLLLCGVVAYVASGRGHSGLLFFLVSMFLSPLVGLILALLIPTRKQRSALDYSNSTGSVADEIKKLQELVHSGAITQAEFESKKRQLMSY